MTWHLNNLATFDTESTGTDLESDRIVSATVAQIIPGQQPAVASHLIAVDVDIPVEATAVHGITTEHARANGKPAVEVLEPVAAHLAELWANNVPVVIMNAVFDLTLLDRELRRHGLPTLDARLGRPVGPVIDPMCIDKAMDRFRKGGRKLTDLCATYGVRHGGAHDATEDALGAARVAYRMGQRAAQAVADPEAVSAVYADRRYPHELVRGWVALGQMSVAELHAAQVRWYAEQSTSLAAFWRQKANQTEHDAINAQDDADRETGLAEANRLRDQADGVTGEWPVRPWGGS